MEPMPFDILTAVWRFGPEMALYMLVQAVAVVVCIPLVRKYLPTCKDPTNIADCIVSMVVFPIMCVWAFGASFNLCHDVESRWRGQTVEGHSFLILYTARAIVHCFMQPFIDMSTQQLVLMTIHHMLSVMCFGGGLVSEHMHFFGCLNGCSEISTIFLTNLCLYKDMTASGVLRPSPFWRLFNKWNGILLWLTYFIFRILLFPYWLYRWTRDIFEVPELTWNRVHSFERYMYPAVTVFLLGISTVWFLKISKGALRELGFLPSKDRKEE
mmetsp:Transcript_19342/g.41126  ORF Transcript_19342/g.41126 Transcript_19342/m.41126 type:complete len:269 (-) Transcript_19342:138-944(-)